MFARLSQEDQKEHLDEFIEYVWRGDERDKQYMSIANTKSYIESEIMHNLSAAPFKKDDATLNPKAGPFTICVYRSGFSLLFLMISKKLTDVFALPAMN